MAWARLDDSLHDHPKVDSLSLSALGLWTLCLTWACRHAGAAGLEPGTIPRQRVTKFRGTKKLAAELVDAELWHPVDGGWIIHDFTRYLPPGYKIESPEDRDKRLSEAGRRGAAARWHPSDPHADANAIASDP